MFMVAVSFTSGPKKILSSAKVTGVKDTIVDDTTLLFPFTDYQNQPSIISNRSPLYMSNPSNINSTVEYDPKTQKFVFYDKIGNFNYRNPYYMSSSEYFDYKMKKSAHEYWMEKSTLESTQDGGSLVDKLVNQSLVVPIKGFEEIFGSNVINIKPQGNAELIFGLNISKVENPTLPENLQKNITFDFDEKIKMGVSGQIGDKLKMGINYDTEATFEFENNIKLAYQGKEDEIIQKIEAGNVSMPLTGTLITGSSSLWGIKTELKFGKLTVSSILSQQKGEIQTIEVEGGAMTTPFEISADSYEANKHYFLSQYFRDHYNSALEDLPVVKSNITITKIEVWVTNRSGNFENSRNIAAFIDLGEAQQHIYSPGNFTGGGIYPANNTNNLYSLMTTTYSGIRDINTTSSTLSGIPNFNQGEDYEKVQNARLLNQSEYTLNPNLGYISLNSSLNNDEVLAVAYEYNAGGKSYRVGEFSNENPPAPETLILKLIKTTTLSTSLPSWKLMMKNVYSINAYQVNKEDFRFEILYRDDKTGSSINYIPAGNINGKILLNVLRLDNLNKNNEAGADGFFDFIDKITINASNGKIYFPVLEPFGNYLRDKITGGTTSNPELNRLADQYVFDELYNKTQSQAQQIAEKNKFFFKGSYRSAGGSEINLNAMNVPEGSVKVTAGGRELQENTHYTVDYNLGRVTILDQSLLESGTPIKISLESNSMYNIGTKTLYGTHLDYRFSDKFNIGATMMHLNQKPLTTKVNIGNEPISNTIWGTDINYNREVPFLTNLVDKIPFIETKEKSLFDFTGEFAQLIPGHPKIVGEEGFAHIDDFEATKTTIDLKSPTSWYLASTPQGQSDLFPEADSTNTLSYGFNRAKIAWYNINPDFLRNTASVPDYITPEDQSDHRVREVMEQELFPDRDPIHGVPPIISVLNIGYYPSEKGPYNYDSQGIPGISAGVDENGNLINPQTRWAGVMRSLITNDFEDANIEFIEFWVMDPFISEENKTGGELYFNLGNVSEDILRDSRQSFENGLPTGTTIENVDSSVWGRVPILPRITEGFANEPVNARDFQDTGLDGLANNDEVSFFSSYLENLASLYGINSPAYIKAAKDPSSDDYRFFKDPAFDDEQASILERYKYFNNMERNSSIPNTGDNTMTAGQQLPDMEDINRDYTLSETETYFQYKLRLEPENMKIGSNFITDIKESTVTLKNDTKETVKWYHFKVPIQDYQKKVGPIQDFKSIRFMRMFLHGWDESIILRFAELNLVRGEWRKYSASMLEGTEGTGVPEITSAQFDISAVNIEENAYRQPVNYVLPPGVTREISHDQPQLRELNEQAIALKVLNLADGDARAAYKNVNLDVRQFKRLQMFIHAEAVEEEILNDRDMCAFIRLGSDYQENYYEYEVPLTLTQHGWYNKDTEKDLVWPSDNTMDIDFETLQLVKQRRNNKLREPENTLQLTSEYSEVIDEYGRRVSVVGNPNLSNVRTIMIGIRNRSKDKNHLIDDGFSKSIEVWMNELRLTEFNEKGGWASQARMNIRLADFSNISVEGNYSTPGFGSIEKRVSERQKSTDFGYNFSSNFEIGKFFPQKYNVRIPLYVAYSEDFSNPQYNPLDPDILLKTSLSDPNLSQSDKDSILRVTQDYTKRKSINVTNMKIGGNTEKEPAVTKTTNIPPENRNYNQRDNREGNKNKPFYHISNWTASYGYNELFIRNINTDHNLLKVYAGALAYNYNISPKNITPFKNSKFLRKKAFALIKDFNFYYAPSMLSFRNDIRKSYNEIQLRNIENKDIIIPPTFDKQFTWQRTYDLRYNFSRNLKFTYSATNSSWVEEPYGRIDKQDPMYQQKIDTVWNSIRDFGRTTDFTQKLQANWTIPINKLPGFDWTSANAKYGADYFWSYVPQPADSTINLGNNIRNVQIIQLSGQLNFSKLYTKVKYLKEVDNSVSKNNRNKQKKFKNVNYEQNNISLREKRAKTITHNLRTSEVTIKVTDDKGNEISGITEIVSENKIKFTPDKTQKDAKISVSGKREITDNIFKVITDHSVYALMSVRNISLTYTENNSTIVPGYLPKTKFFGMNQTWDAPGWEYILGVQNNDFGQLAAQSGWLSGDSLINSPLITNKDVSYNLKATLTPINGLRIDVTADMRSSMSGNEHWVSRDQGFVSENKFYQGNYSISTLSIKTAFMGINDSTYESPEYDAFLNNRITIAQRLSANRQSLTGVSYNPDEPLIDPVTGETLNQNYPNGYGGTSQEVLLPAFLAAYTGQSSSVISTNPFPNIPLPNWRLKYEGLTDFDFVKKAFKKVIFNHGYSSNYRVSSFQTNSGFNFEEYANYGISSSRDELSQLFIPEYQLDGVAIDEKFIPLAGLDLTMKNDLSAKIEYKQARSVALSFANNQILEARSKEYTFGIGYKIPNLEIPLSIGGNQQLFKSDLNLRADLTYRDMLTIVRRINEADNQLSAGQKNFSLKINADYNLNKVTLRLFYDQTINTPRVSTSYRTSNTKIGFSIRFNLANI